MPSTVVVVRLECGGGAEIALFQEVDEVAAFVVDAGDAVWYEDLLDASVRGALVVIEEFIDGSCAELGIAIVAGDDCPVFCDVRVELCEMFFEGELF